MDMQKKTRRKRAWTLGLTLAVNLAVVAFIAVREFGAKAAQAQAISLDRLRPGYLALAAGCFFLALYTEYAKYRRMIMAEASRDDRRGALECAILGKYYDNITPLGAGGQPFQIYYLRKRGLPAGASAALPIAGFLVLQLAFILIAGIVFVSNPGAVGGQPVLRASAWVGLAFYAFIPLCIILFALAPRPFEAFMCGGARFLGRLHILKDGERAAEKLFDSLNAYIVSLRAMNRRKFLFLRMMAYAVVYQAAILSVPYFVLRAFGSAESWWAVFSLVVYVYAAITIVPTPGNAGAAEGTFYAAFSSLQGGFLFWAMLLWRVLVYYSWLAAGLAVLTCGTGAKGETRKTPVPAEGPLRVALFTDLFYPAVDGVIRTVDAYARRMDEKGGYACVVCPSQGLNDDARRRYDIFRTPSIRIPGFAFRIPLPILTRRERQFFRDGQFNVFHAHSPFFVGGLAIRLGRRLGVPVVATFHSKYYDDALNITHSKFLATILMHRVVDFYCKVDEVWACSQATAETLRGYGFRGNIRVMENGIEPLPRGNGRVLAELAGQRFGIRPGRPVLLFVGQQIWQKGLRLVLDTAKLLADAGADFQTVIAGAGYNSEDIKKYAGSLGLEDRVIFTGIVTDRALLYGLYYRAELFFFPSLYDNAPLVLREAAQAGLPALLTAGANAAEVVTDGYNGYTAAYDAAAMADKIRAIFRSGERAQVGRRARDTIPVSWDTVVGAAQAAYRGTDIDIHAGV